MKRKQAAVTLAITAAANLATIPAISPSSHAAPPVNAPCSWRELPNPSPVGSAPGANYYTFPLDNGTKAHLIVADLTSGKWRVKPALSAKTKSTSEIARACGATAAINGGYFNLSDGVSASYVSLNGQQVADPRTNKALTGNPKLQPHLEKIFARTEIRFLKNKDGKQLVQFAGHNESLPAGTKLIDSLQAGPRLLPCLTAKEEAFIRTEPDGSVSDSIGTSKLAARTAFGITDDGHGLMLTVAGKGQEDGSSGLTLTGLAELMKGLGCTQAINLDGGASTTMFAGTTTVCGKKPETRVKSILMLEQTSNDEQQKKDERAKVTTRPAWTEIVGKRRK